MSVSRTELQEAAMQFCSAFAAGSDIDTLLSLFSTQQPISTIEYGEPGLATFLGRTFEGREGVRRYLGIISALLTIENVTFSEYLVDAESMKVGVKGKGKFTWRETQESWDETFSYVLDFDHSLRVVRYQVWADSGAAYLARVGKLSDIRK